MMRRDLIRGAAIAAAVGLAGWTGASYARAADAEALPPSSGWRIDIAPYVWLAGVQADVEIGDFPDIRIVESFTEILDNLNAIFMARAEAQSGRVGLLADFVYVDTNYFLTVFDIEIDFDDKLAFGTLAASYRSLETAGGSYFDVLAGGRVWYYETDVVDRDDNIDAVLWSDKWVDPILGARARINFTDRFYASAYGDIGGFGFGSELTWQVTGSLGYQVHEHFDISAGYRYLYFRRVTDEIRQDMTISGPTIAATFTF